MAFPPHTRIIDRYVRFVAAQCLAISVDNQMRDMFVALVAQPDPLLQSRIGGSIGEPYVRGLCSKRRRQAGNSPQPNRAKVCPNLKGLRQRRWVSRQLRQWAVRLHARKRRLPIPTPTSTGRAGEVIGTTGSKRPSDD